jgi:hypothetical protein
LPSASAQPAAPAPPPTPTPSPQAKPKAEEQEEQEPGGILGPFRLGPVVGVGLPNLLSFGGTTKLTRYLGAGLNIGLIPTVRISYYGDATLAYQEYDIYGRIYPFGGAFFVGAGVGYETVTGTLSDTFDTSTVLPPVPGQTGSGTSIAINNEASVHTLVLTPQIGLFHTYGSGFSIGADIGAQVPIAPSDISVSTQVRSDLPQSVVDKYTRYVQANDQKVLDTLEKVGRTSIPTFNVRIGWLL